MEGCSYPLVVPTCEEAGRVKQQPDPEISREGEETDDELALSDVPLLFKSFRRQDFAFAAGWRQK